MIKIIKKHQMKLAVSGKSYEKGHEQTDKHQNIDN